MPAFSTPKTVARKLKAADLSGYPTADPGNGQPWIDAEGIVRVGSVVATNAPGKIQWHLDNSETYAASQVGGRYVLENLADTGNTYSASPEPPCYTGTATASEYIDLGSGFLLGSGDWELELDVYLEDTAAQYAIFSQFDVNNRGVIIFHSNTLGWRLTYSTATASEGSVSAVAGTWYRVKAVYSDSAGTATLYIDDVQVAQRTGVSDIAQPGGCLIGAYGNNIVYNGTITNPLKGRVSNVFTTAGGLTRYVTLQEGWGRNVYILSSDGTSSVVADAVVNGSLDTIWANRSPGLVRDWSIDNGGGLGPQGEFVPGRIGQPEDAEGTTKRYTSGKIGNPHTRTNTNPGSFPALVAVGSESSLSNRESRPNTATEDSKFARVLDDGMDRLVTTSAALTGSELSNMLAYTPREWIVRVATWNIYGLAGGTFGLNGGVGTNWDRIRTQIARYRPDVLGLTEMLSDTYRDRFSEQNGYTESARSSGGQGTIYQAGFSRYGIESSSVIPSGSGGDEYARPPLYIEVDFGHPTKKLAVAVIHSQTGGIAADFDSGTFSRLQNQYRRALEFYRIKEFLASKVAANPNLVPLIIGDWNDDPALHQNVTVTSSATDGLNDYAGFVLGAGAPASFDYKAYPTKQCSESGYELVDTETTDGDTHTLQSNTPNAAVTQDVQIDFVAFASGIGATLVASEVADAEASQATGITKYGAVMPSDTSRCSDHLMVVMDLKFTVQNG